jgi:hypothetical protein
MSLSIHHNRVGIKHLAIALLGLTMSVAAPSDAFGQNETKSRIQVEKFSNFLSELETTKLESATLQTRDRAQQWLEDARVLLADDQGEQAQRLLKRVELGIELIQARIKARRLEDKADMQQKAYYRVQNKKMPSLKEQIEQLEETKQKLKKKLQQ